MAWKTRFELRILAKIQGARGARYPSSTSSASQHKGPHLCILVQTSSSSSIHIPANRCLLNTPWVQGCAHWLPLSVLNKNRHEEAQADPRSRLGALGQGYQYPEYPERVLEGRAQAPSGYLHLALWTPCPLGRGRQGGPEEGPLTPVLRALVHSLQRQEMRFFGISLKSSPEWQGKRWVKDKGKTTYYPEALLPCVPSRRWPTAAEGREEARHSTAAGVLSPCNAKWGTQPRRVGERERKREGRWKGTTFIKSPLKASSAHLRNTKRQTNKQKIQHKQ